MTAERNMEHVLQRWLVDGVDEMPDRVYLSILDRVERQPQQRAWRVSWRPSNMNGSLRWIAAAAATILIAVAGFALLRPTSESDVGGPPATRSPSPPSPNAPSAAATLRWDAAGVGPCGEHGCGGPLTSGTYTSTGFKPAVTYTLTIPWVNVRDWAEFFMLYPDTPVNRATAADGGYPPFILINPGPAKVSLSARCPDESARDAVEVDAAGFVEYLASREGLAVTQPVPVTLSGLRGQQVDVAVAPGWTGCLPHTPMDDPRVQPESIRYVVLDKPDGDSLVITQWAPSYPDSFFAQAMEVVDSFEFDLTP